MPASPETQTAKETPAGTSATKSEPAAARRPARHGWMIQVGAFPDENEAKGRLHSAQSKAGKFLRAADAFTERVVKGDKTLYRARFAGFEKDKAEAACKHLKKNDIACMTIKN
jgi:D-alanyl-D-alanine carboxypeptidase